VRDCYESLVIYSFMVLILEYAGGEANCVTKMQGRPPLPYPFPGCWLAPRPRTVDLLRECKRGTLQFVVLKPLLGLLSMIMVGAGAYDSAAYQTFLLTVYNVAYTVALYYLLLFYLATKEACAKHQPVTKFVAVKSVVFFTYYQSIGIRLLPNMTFEEAQSWGDFILCVEMIMFSLMLGGAFGAAPYDQSSGKSSGRSSSSSSRGNGGSSGSGGSVGMTVMGSGSDSGGGLGAHRTGAVEGGGLRGVLTNDGRQQLLSNARNALTVMMTTSLSTTYYISIPVIDLTSIQLALFSCPCVLLLDHQQVRDIVADTYHNFASKYQDYALQTEERDDGLFVGSQRSTLSRHSHPYYDRSSSSSSGKHLSSSSGSFLGIFDTQRSFKAALDARRRRQRSRLPVDMTGDGIGSGGAEDGGVRELYFIGTCWGVETSLYLCVEPNVGASTTEAVPGAGVGIMTSVSRSSNSALMKEEPASASAAAAATISDACVCHGEGLNCNGYFEVKGIYRKVYGDFVDPSSYVPHLSPQAALSAGDPVAWRAAVACGGAPPPEPAAPPRRVLEGERFELSCVNNHGTVQLVLSRRLGRDDDDDDDVVELEMVDDGSANTPTASKSSSSDTSGSDGAPTNRELPNHQQHPRKRERAKFGGALWAQHAAPLVQFHKLAVDLKANLHQAGTTMLRRSRSSRNNNAASGAATSPSSSPTSMSTPATTPEGVEAVAGTANGVATSETDGACSDAGVMEAGVAKATSAAAAAAAAATVAEDEDSSNGVAEDVKAEEASSGLVWLNLRGLPSADAGAEDTLELHDLQALGGLGLRRLNETSAARAAVLARRLKWRNDTAPVAGTSAAGVRAADTSGSAGGTAVAAGSAAVTDAVSDATAPPAAAEASALTAMNLAAPLAGSLEDFPPMVVPRGIDCSGEGADFEPMTQPEVIACVCIFSLCSCRPKNVLSYSFV
jgi:hypothetical protein